LIPFIPKSLGLTPGVKGRRKVSEIDKEEACLIKQKFNIKALTKPDLKFKSINLETLLKEEGFEDVYANVTQGICNGYFYSDSFKRAKYKIWKLLRDEDLEKYFESIEVTEID
jgi:histidinol phosphatase-like enzyme